MQKAQPDKTRVETAQFWKETFWYPVFAAAGLLGTGAAAAVVAAAIIKFIL